jgi:hypothetical protein
MKIDLIFALTTYGVAHVGFRFRSALRGDPVLGAIHKHSYREITDRKTKTLFISIYIWICDLSCIMDEASENEFYIRQMKEELAKQTDTFQPRYGEGKESMKALEMLEFWNHLQELMATLPENEKGKMLLEVAGKKIQLCVDKAAISRILSAAIKPSKEEEGVIWLPVEEYKEKSRQVYGMMDWMLGMFKQSANNMKAVGYKYMDMNCTLNGQKYASMLPIDDVIPFLDSIEPVDMMAQFQMPEINFNEDSEKKQEHNEEEKKE